MTDILSGTVELPTGTDGGVPIKSPDNSLWQVWAYQNLWLGAAGTNKYIPKLAMNTIDTNQSFHVAAVYQIANTETGECYIGATNNLANRYREHFDWLNSGKHRNPLLQKSFDSAKQPFEFVAFITNDGPIAFAIEKELIKRNKGKPTCLNLRGGCEYAGRKRVVSEEGRKRLSEAQKRKFSAGLQSPMKGRKHTDEARKKMSLRAKQRMAGGTESIVPGYVMTTQERAAWREKVEARWADPEKRRAAKRRGIERFQDPEFLDKWKRERYGGEP